MYILEFLILLTIILIIIIIEYYIILLTLYTPINNDNIIVNRIGK